MDDDAFVKMRKIQEASHDDSSALELCRAAGALDRDQVNGFRLNVHTDEVSRVVEFFELAAVNPAQRAPERLRPSFGRRTAAALPTRLPRDVWTACGVIANPDHDSEKSPRLVEDDAVESRQFAAGDPDHLVVAQLLHADLREMIGLRRK
ncbi:hypothetical protein GALL_475550 [mine drainage metagenome]|uniref:Uncharacterized protein n=1 Tax=mine drainage metagenome TaxID=410659 RepID=A0A1J5PHA0_9ZZZZ